MAAAGRWCFHDSILAREPMRRVLASFLMVCVAHRAGVRRTSVLQSTCPNSDVPRPFSCGVAFYIDLVLAASFVEAFFATSCALEESVPVSVWFMRRLLTASPWRKPFVLFWLVGVYPCKCGMLESFVHSHVFKIERVFFVADNNQSQLVNLR